jgi:hypothetical protein
MDKWLVSAQKVLEGDTSRLGEFLLPVLIYGCVAILAVTLVSAVARSIRRLIQGKGGSPKLDLKKELLYEFRRRMAPLPAAELAKHLGIDVFETARLLGELEKDLVLESYTNTQRLTLWRLRESPTYATSEAR